MILLLQSRPHLPAARRGLQRPQRLMPCEHMIDSTDRRSHELKMVRHMDQQNNIAGPKQRRDRVTSPAFFGPNKTGTSSFAILGTTRQASAFCHNYSTHGRSSGMSRARILTLSVVAAITLGSGALAQGGGGGGGAGGGASGAGGAAGGSGAGGAAGGSAGSAAGASGAHGAAGGSSTPGTGNPNSPVSVQPPGSTGQNTINSPGTGAGPGPSPAPPNK
jgi:hypothetical protein